MFRCTSRERRCAGTWGKSKLIKAELTQLETPKIIKLLGSFSALPRPGSGLCGTFKSGPESATRNSGKIFPVRNTESGTVQNYQNHDQTWSIVNFFFTLVIFVFNVKNSLIFTFFITVTIENIMVTLDGGIL